MGVSRDHLVRAPGAWVEAVIGAESLDRLGRRLARGGLSTSATDAGAELRDALEARIRAALEPDSIERSTVGLSRLDFAAWTDHELAMGLARRGIGRSRKAQRRVLDLLDHVHEVMTEAKGDEAADDGG